MKRILMVVPFITFESEGYINRFTFLYNLLKKDYEVILITSSFNHVQKKQRKINNFNEKYNVQFIYEPGYKKNISIKRLFSHRVFSYKLKKYLTSSGEFDYIYCAFPTPDVCDVTSKYAKKNNIPFIIDIQDVWPEAMHLVLKNKTIANILLFPMKQKVKKIYNRADYIIGVSQTYIDICKGYLLNDKKSLKVYIGVDLSLFDCNAQTNMPLVNKEINEFWITYTGTMGSSYDIETLIKSIQILNSKGLKNIKLILIGSGPLQKRFVSLAQKLGINYIALGNIDHSLVCAYLKKSDLAANCIKKKAEQSITNKIGDYVSAGLPILNGCKNMEFFNIVEKEKIGVNYKPEDANDLATKIEYLYNNEAIRITMSENSRSLAIREFDRNNTYRKIRNVLSELGKE